MRLMMRALIVGLLLVAVPGWSPASVSNAQSGLASASIDPSQQGMTISPTYMGFSHEWDDGPPLNGGGALLMGSPATGTNPIYRQLVQNLLAYGAGPFVVRIGGNSTDATKEPGPGVVDPFAQLNADSGATFILSVNLGSGDPKLATDQASAYVQGMPAGSINAIEIGNEPDFYAGNGHRPKTYTMPGYFKDFASWRSAILPVLPSGLKLAGPSWGSLSYTAQLPTFLDQETPYLAMVTQHTYAGTACNKSNPPDFLLDPTAATISAKGAGSSVQVTHQRGQPYRMAEMNSISCAGQPGVSDVFASALWAPDVLFELANIGVDGVNIHFGNSGAYALFTFNVANSDGSTTYSVQSIRPEYYGVLLFQQAAPAQSRIVPVKLNTSANVKIWTTEDGAGTLRILVVNKDKSASGPVSIQLSGYGDGTLTRLQAPGFDAQTGVTLGGQTFDGSPDGTLQGDAVSDTVGASGGVYTFDVPPVSAALMLVSPAGS